MVLWRPTRPFRTNTQKRCSFHYRGLECKSRKSGNTWNNRQIWPWSTEWSRAKSNRVLPREHTGHSKHPLPTMQEDSTHEHHLMVNIKIRLIIFFAAKDGEAVYSQQKQDQELTVAQIMNSLLPNSDLNWRKHGKALDHSVQFSSVAQSCLTLCNPMSRSTPGLPVHHQLLEFTQTQIHWDGDAISHLMLCHPLLLLPPNPPSIKVF